jgi:polyhydroxybutyrate depolymerase
MQMTIDVGGRRRTLTVVGAPASDRARDLVLLLHGSKQDGAAYRRATGGAFDALADDGGAVVAYLDGNTRAGRASTTSASCGRRWSGSG